jgi:hypothetical protein
MLCEHNIVSSAVFGNHNEHISLLYNVAALYARWLHCVQAIVTVKRSVRKHSVGVIARASLQQQVAE